MKLFTKLSLITTLISISQISIAQHNIHKNETLQKKQGTAYTFQKSNAAYQTLVNSISLNKGQTWYLPTFKIPVEFDFTMLGQKIDTFSMGNSGGTSLSYSASTFKVYYIDGINSDIQDRNMFTNNKPSVSPLSYKVEGSIGSRVLKVEWKNVGFYWEDDSLHTTNDFMNYQVWLYEGSNDVEYHYGNSKITNKGIDFLSFDGETYIGLELQDEESYYLKGDPANPTLTYTFDYQDNYPDSGTVYRFINTKNVAVKNTKSNINATLYPNPITENSVLEFKNIMLQNAEIKITDISGKEIFLANNINGSTINISKNNFNQGLYFYTVYDKNEGYLNGKFIVN